MFCASPLISMSTRSVEQWPFKDSGIRNNVTVVLGQARPIDGAMLAASVFLEFHRYACEHVGEEAARDWLAETIWMFGLHATAQSLRLFNERDRQRLLEKSEVVGI